jgi:hypothetical protein
MLSLLIGVGVALLAIVASTIFDPRLRVPHEDCGDLSATLDVTTLL